MFIVVLGFIGGGGGGGAIRTLRLALRETDRAQFLAPNQEIFGLSMHILVNLVFVAELRVHVRPEGKGERNRNQPPGSRRSWSIEAPLLMLILLCAEPPAEVDS